MQGERFDNVSVRALRDKFERLAQAANAALNANGAAQPNAPNPAPRPILPAAAPAADAGNLRRLAPNRPALVAAVLDMPRLMNGNAANAQNMPQPGPLAGAGNRPLQPPVGIGNQPLQPPAPLANRPPAVLGNQLIQPPPAVGGGGQPLAGGGNQPSLGSRPPAAGGNQPPR